MNLCGIEVWRRKRHALKQNDGNFDSVVRFSDEAKTEMMWWKDNIRLSYNDIDSSHGEADFFFRRVPDWLGMFL